MTANHKRLLEYTTVRLTTYKFISYVLTTCPNQEFTREICSLSFPDQKTNEGDTSGTTILSQFIKEHGQDDLTELSTKLAVEWTRLFRGVKPGYGPPPAKASVYRAYDIETLLQTYRKFGLGTAQTRFDPDYLGIQLAFLYQLVDQELKCLQEEKLEQAFELQAEQKEFILNHLDWVNDFFRQAEDHMELPFYRGVMLLLIEFLSEELLWFDSLTKC